MSRLEPSAPLPPVTMMLAESEAPELWVDDPGQLGRVSTAFRLILVVPQWVVLYFLGLAAEVILVIAWFAALILGRLPAGLATFLQGCLGYQTRVYGYLLLLTDEYPPFGFDDYGYPVRVLLPRAGRLNRWSVLFRIVLIIPSIIVGTLAVLGWFVASLVIWLVVLVTGTYPASLFRATVALLRFSLRQNAYANLLTSRYPRRLFGDAAPSVESQLQSDRPFALVLSRASKSFVVMFLVLGILGIGGAFAAGIIVGNRHVVTRAEALRDVTAAHSRLGVRAKTFQAAAATCTTDPDRLSCIQRADAGLAQAFDGFDAALLAVDRPEGTALFFRQLTGPTHRVASTLHQLAATPSLAAYSRLSRKLDFAQSTSDFDTAYGILISELGPAG